MKTQKELNERFDEYGFMQYLANTFNGFENCFLRETIENVVHYAHTNTLDKPNNWIAFFVKEFLPDDVKLSEIMQFVKKENHL